ncbi:MAG: amino acid transporter [Mycobacteriaceae bacterium]|nr:amino acid transporter [Mycobacteriaceae bacterium]
MNDEPAQYPGPMSKPTDAEHGHSWWKVMCLTGVDYFSTLGYQPGIAALAAGALSPFATVVLVALTLFGALPVYLRVASESPHGGGSLAMLAEFLPKWKGKITVLVLLGFAMTDFIITMTLSAADGATHLVENPLVPDWLHGHNVLVTLVLLALLAAVFLKGFNEAIGLAVVLVATFLALNLVVAVVGVFEVVHEHQLVVDWSHALMTPHGDTGFWAIVAFSLVVFPKLALGMSGFETGVAVMPQIRTAAHDQPQRPLTRIRGAQQLLTSAALIMSFFLIVTSFATAVLIPEHEFQPGGAANGRAMAYLAHRYLGNAFGTVYDISTIAILWFAGASAMAGLLNLVPRYLPRYGMAPEWARAARPLVLVLTVIMFGVTWYFDADVDAQGGAYATGVLVLITSAALAVAISAWRQNQIPRMAGFLLVTAVFVYTTIDNIIAKPEGVQLAAIFVLAILVVSILSRIKRAFELRAIVVHFDEDAGRIIDDAAATGLIRVVAHDIETYEVAYRRPEVYRDKEAAQRLESHIPAGDPIIFLEVLVRDASEFTSELHVTATQLNGYHILSVEAAAIPNSIAAVLLAVRDRTGLNPHIYFEWTEGNPLTNLVRFLFIGEGEVAPVTREILRRAVPDPRLRPHVHVDS